MNKIKLSYVITTYNKLPFLLESMPRLISAKKPDEEIIVVDGNSSDGSQEYLGHLFQEKKIDQYKSEIDFGEAHGFNKALLMAQGTLIKIITDDDLFDYAKISKCRVYMEDLKNSDIDIVLSPVININDYRKKEYNIIAKIENPIKFELYRQPFNTCGLGIMLRKSSIPLLGLFNPSFVWVDYEYLMRVCYSKANVAIFNSPLAVRFGNTQSNSHKFSKRLDIEKKLINSFHHGIYGSSSDIKLDNLTTFLNFLRMIKQKLNKLLGSYPRGADNLPEDIEQISPTEMFLIGEEILNKYAGETNHQSLFLVNRGR